MQCIPRLDRTSPVNHLSKQGIDKQALLSAVLPGETKPLEVHLTADTERLEIVSQHTKSFEDWDSLSGGELDVLVDDSSINPADLPIQREVYSEIIPEEEYIFDDEDDDEDYDDDDDWM